MLPPFQSDMWFDFQPQPRPKNWSSALRHAASSSSVIFCKGSPRIMYAGPPALVGHPTPLEDSSSAEALSSPELGSSPWINRPYCRRHLMSSSRVMFASVLVELRSTAAHIFCQRAVRTTMISETRIVPHDNCLTLLDLCVSSMQQGVMLNMFKTSPRSCNEFL